jgi:hypothetical protein
MLTDISNEEWHMAEIVSLVHFWARIFDSCSYYIPSAQLRSTNAGRVTMETKRWGLSKGARRELLGMSRRLGISRKEHNNNNNMTKQEQRDTHRENCLAPDTHATQKKIKKYQKKKKETVED